LPCRASAMTLFGGIAIVLRLLVQLVDGPSMAQVMELYTVPAWCRVLPAWHRGVYIAPATQRVPMARSTTSALLRSD
jgi:hypothetical protein